jgi:hypothetical protein
MTLIEGLLISISLCLNAFLLIYIQLTASIILFYYNKIKNLENINKDFENKIEAVGLNDKIRTMNIY